MKSLILLLVSIAAFSQGVNTVPGGVGKASNNVILRGSGNTLPATCVVGQQFFKSNASAGQNLYGCTSANTWTLQGGPTSGSTLIQQATASASASINITGCITSAYDVYEIVLVDVFPTTSADALWLRVSTNGGSSYVSTASYSWSGYVVYWATGAVNGNSGQNQIVLSTNQSNDTTKFGFQATYRLYNPLNAVGRKVITGIGFGYTTTPTLLNWLTFGTYDAATAVNAFQILASTGTLASGTVRCYGIAK